MKRASPTHGGCWLAQTNYDALMTHHTMCTENTALIYPCPWATTLGRSAYCQGSPPWQLLMTQSGTCICWAQSSQVWSHAVRVHHWIGWKCNRPLSALRGPMYWMVPGILCMSNADTVVAQCQWSITWTLIRIFGRGATVNSWVEILSRWEFLLLKV